MNAMTKRGYGIFLLAVWLIVVNVLDLLNLINLTLFQILAVVGLVVGALLLWEVKSKNIVRNLGIILLAIWLILVGVGTFINLSSLSSILNILAIVAGVLLIGQGYMTGMMKNLGMLLTGVWVGVPPFLVLLGISIGGLGIVFTIVGLVAGLLLLMDR